MFGQNETLLREYYWTDTATMISALRIELIDQKRTALSVGEKSDNKKRRILKPPELLLQGTRRMAIFF